MRATAFEFHYRFWFIVAIYVLGFTAPWDLALHLDGVGSNSHVWGLLAAQLAKHGILSIEPAFDVLLIVGIFCALAGAWLRTWGSAYLTAEVMRDTSMRGDAVVADGPYRYMRNPLYLGSWLNALTLSLLMPVSGAIFTLLALIGFQVRLILSEEAFLTAKLGDSYTAYSARVPRILPAPGSRVPPSGARPRWREAVVAEIFMWGSALSFAALGWRYNALLLIQCVLVWLGVTLVVRGVGTERGTPSADM
jgi:protein-S-isoprenylcysteine O-methyltransferase Ste14